MKRTENKISKLALVFLGAIIGVSYHLAYAEIKEDMREYNEPIYQVEKVITITRIDEPLTVEEEIVALANEYGVNPNDALRIAECESNTGTNLFNGVSSAKGIFQFINNTWANYCNGDVLDQTDNITCFMELYNNNPNWWQCK